MCETQLSHIQLGALSRIEAYRVRRALLFNAIHLVTTVLFVACTLFKLATSEALFTVTLINVYACVLGIMLFVIERT
ncbi:hypothetical protein BC828DRAFT_373589 [Blastocladiella britannica]|nr:hypothetical protein BC828DRAFT_373589 [Blastocladiella britannica]